MAKKKTEEIIHIDVVTKITDNGDGGFSCRLYNNDEEMLADCYELEDLEGDEYEAKKEEILSGDDEYQNGYLDTATIKIKKVGDKYILAESPYFHGGQ